MSPSLRQRILRAHGLYLGAFAFVEQDILTLGYVSTELHVLFTMLELGAALGAARESSAEGLSVA